MSRSSAQEVPWWDVRSVPTLGEGRDPRSNEEMRPPRFIRETVYNLMKSAIVLSIMQIAEIAESLRPRWSWDVKEKKVRTSTPF